jgi:ficolin
MSTELRIDLEDFDGNRKYAVYNGVSVTSADYNYRLDIGDYSGDAGMLSK